MAKKPRYYIVESSALPEIFLKVAEAKQMLATGDAETVNEATNAVGISRSAFYKYRDAILPFQNLLAGRIITFQVQLQDVAGTLSGVLQILASKGANLLTINSNIPADGCAAVSITAETNAVSCTLEDLLDDLSEAPGVIRAEIRAG